MNSIISIITPSFNQAQYISDTIESVLKQDGDFYIDYIIIDGASSDGSKSIIKKYKNLLKKNCKIIKKYGLNFYINDNTNFKLNSCRGISYRWLSEKDNGHAEALNKGFSKSIGNVLCWINSDDKYHDNAFKTVMEIFKAYPDVNWITGLNTLWNSNGENVLLNHFTQYNYKNIYDFLTGNHEWIQQESTFWTRSLWKKAGGKINEDYKFMVDGELWCRFFIHDNLYHVNAKLSGYRSHATNRAKLYLAEVKNEMSMAIDFLKLNTSKDKLKVINELENRVFLNKTYPKEMDYYMIDSRDTKNKWTIKRVGYFAYNYAKYKELAITKDQNFYKILRDKDEQINSLQKKINNSKKIFSVRSSIRSYKNKLISLFQKLQYPLGLNWGMITTPDIYLFEEIDFKKTVKRMIYSKPNIPLGISTDFLFIKSLIRQDYNKYFNNVVNTCNKNKASIDIKYTQRKKINKIFILRIFLCLPIFFKIFHGNFKLSIYRYFRVIEYLSVLSIIKKYRFNVLVAFADMQGVENMLVQYFRKKGKKTVTLQHGLYIDYHDFDNINKVNYQNVVSDYFLAWGKETGELISKYHPKVNVEICGKPISMNSVNNECDYFTLVFDQTLFRKQNKELLSIANSIAKLIGIKINVRIHPWDKKHFYSFNNKIHLFDQSISQSKFVIGHTTSMIYECMRNGKPSFKYKTDIPSNKIHDDIFTFKNKFELLEKIKKINNIDFVEISKYYIQHISDESLNQYSEFFKNLSDERIKNT